LLENAFLPSSGDPPSDSRWLPGAIPQTPRWYPHLLLKFTHITF